MANNRLNLYRKSVSTKSANMNRKACDQIIERYGIQVFYLPRTTPNLDRIFGDDPTSTFDSAHELTMLPDDPEFFNGGGQKMSGFGGFTSNYHHTLYIEIDRFTNMTGLDNPSEDDKLYVLLHNKWYRIKSCSDKPQFYYGAQLYVYKIQIEEDKPSHEPISTGEPEVDNNIPVTQDQVNPDSTEIDTKDQEDSIIEGFEDLLNEE